MHPHGRLQRRRRRSQSRFALRFRSLPEPPDQRDNLEAAELSRELGGTDRHVKKHFFALAASELRPILASYEDRYGHRARETAEVSLPGWRAGSAIMSGRVARRLYELLPPRMPVEARYTLVEGLWRHVSPGSHRTLRVGAEVPADEIVVAVGAHVDAVMTGHRIPEELQRRFRWLSDADVQAKQDLLNHRNALEKTLILDALRVQLPTLLRHTRGEASSRATRLAQVFTIGKHELELVLDPSATGIAVDEPRLAAALSKTRHVFGQALGTLRMTGHRDEAR